MPVYEYKCNDCGNIFDIFTVSHDHQHPCCPKCGKCNTKKLVSRLGFMKHPDQSTPSSPPLPDIKPDK